MARFVSPSSPGRDDPDPVDSHDKDGRLAKTIPAALRDRMPRLLFTKSSSLSRPIAKFYRAGAPRIAKVRPTPSRQLEVVRYHDQRHPLLSFGARSNKFRHLVATLA